MTRGVTMGRDRVFLLVGGGRTVPVRVAGSHDRRDLERLAALDSSDVLTGRVLTGSVDGELRAAVSLDDGRAIANPFVATRDLVDSLRALAWRS